MSNNIRPYEIKDQKTVRYICSALDQNLELSSLIYCDYYIEKEPEICFVAVDEFDNPCGCILATKSFYTYQREYEPYLTKLKKANYTSYSHYKKINKQLDDISIDYPAHLIISILPSFQNKGFGKLLFDTLVNKLKTFNVKGINIILNKNQSAIIPFFERLGFEKKKKITSKDYIYVYTI